jgi:LacI family transcriptional regulator
VAISVPAQLAIVAFDETDIFDFFYSPVTYIKQPLEEMAKLSTRILLDNIMGKRIPQHVVLPPQLMVRDSSVKIKRHVAQLP